MLFAPHSGQRRSPPRGCAVRWFRSIKSIDLVSIWAGGPLCPRPVWVPRCIRSGEIWTGRSRLATNPTGPAATSRPRRTISSAAVVGEAGLELTQLGEVVLQLRQPGVALATVVLGGVGGGAGRVGGRPQSLVVDHCEVVAQRPVHRAQLGPQVVAHPEVR